MELNSSHPQLQEAKKYINEAMKALESVTTPNTSHEILATQALQKAQQAITSLKSSLDPSEKKEAEKTEQSLLKAKQALLESELNNNK